jgi:phosphoribosylaminoimidazole carboxylase PurE protein
MKKEKSSKKTKPTKSYDVAVVMGSDSDLRVMNDAINTLKDFGVSQKVQILSAHRTPKEMIAFAETAHADGYKVIIAGAGGSAHLPGMIASATTLPVIGVPVQLKHLDGLDSLLSIVQMPKGVPVATMAIDNATNAALLAIRILGIESQKLQAKLQSHQAKMKTKVKLANQSLKKTKAK